jgi:hypothetical protein
MERDAGIRVIPLVDVRSVLEYLGGDGAQAAVVAEIQAYQARYGVA